ncbi:MAG: zeta toxin family protein [Planctomycetota bacterium]|jgi:predicted ABC-type ATPase|nr:zeta toxin family protein [Planctomycetota bacterium]
MENKQPHVIILAGPNGSGKSTSAPVLLRDTFAVEEFVNADAIAQGLSAFAPETVALEAGKIMVKRLRELVQKRSSFAFETTLASRSFAPWLKKLQDTGYQTHLLFLALPDAQTAEERVAARVKLGGHNIPVDIIQRRFNAGLRNLFQLYIPSVTSWKILDNSIPGHSLDVTGGRGYNFVVTDKAWFERLKMEYSHDR